MSTPRYIGYTGAFELYFFASLAYSTDSPKITSAVRYAYLVKYVQGNNSCFIIDFPLINGKSESGHRSITSTTNFILCLLQYLAHTKADEEVGIAQ